MLINLKKILNPILKNKKSFYSIIEKVLKDKEKKNTKEYEKIWNPKITELLKEIVNLSEINLKIKIEWDEKKKESFKKQNNLIIEKIKEIEKLSKDKYYTREQYMTLNFIINILTWFDFFTNMWYIDKTLVKWYYNINLY